MLETFLIEVKSEAYDPKRDCRRLDGRKTVSVRQLKGSRGYLNAGHGKEALFGAYEPCS